MKSTELAIGAVAAHFGLPTHVLRHWEAEGLLAPERTAADRRRYTTADLYRVAAILVGKRAGLALPDIRAVLTAEEPTTRQEVLHRHRQDLVARIEAARAALAMIDGALGCTHDDLATCPHFQGLLHARVDAGAGQ